MHVQPISNFPEGNHLLRNSIAVLCYYALLFWRCRGPSSRALFLAPLAGMYPWLAAATLCDWRCWTWCHNLQWNGTGYQFSNMILLPSPCRESEKIVASQANYYTACLLPDIMRYCRDGNSGRIDSADCNYFADNLWQFSTKRVVRLYADVEAGYCHALKQTNDAYYHLCNQLSAECGGRN